MSLEAALGVIGIAAAIGIWGGAAVSTFIERENGAETAERLNSPILMGIVIVVLLALAAGFLLPKLNIPLFDKVSVVVVLLNVLVTGVVGGGLIYIVWKRRKLTAESLLLDAGRDVHPGRLLIGGYFLLQLLPGLVNVFRNEEQNLGLYPGDIAMFVLFGVVLIAWMMSSCAKVYFVKEGISLFRLTMIKWGKIRDYTWSVRNENKVSVILKGGRRVEFSIAGKYKAQVEEILRAKTRESESLPLNN